MVVVAFHIWHPKKEGDVFAFYGGEKKLKANLAAGKTGSSQRFKRSRLEKLASTAGMPSRNRCLWGGGGEKERGCLHLHTPPASRPLWVQKESGINWFIHRANTVLGFRDSVLGGGVVFLPPAPTTPNCINHLGKQDIQEGPVYK